jgi:hypothetical protein
MSRGEAERLRDVRDAITAIRSHLEQVGHPDEALLHDAPP